MYFRLIKHLVTMKVPHHRSENVQHLVPLGPSLMGRIENEPNRSDSRSKVDSEVDLLKDCYQRRRKKRTPGNPNVRSRKNSIFNYGA
jgi:hypothetical protein